MNFDIQAPGIDFMVIVPALIVVVVGLLLPMRLNEVAAGAIAGLLPGIVLVVLTLADEGHLDGEGLAYAPFGWFVWTVLSLPGVLLGLVLLFALRKLRAPRPTGLD